MPVIKYTHKKKFISVYVIVTNCHADKKKYQKNIKLIWNSLILDAVEMLKLGYF